MSEQLLYKEPNGMEDSVKSEAEESRPKRRKGSGDDKPMEDKRS